MTAIGINAAGFTAQAGSFVSVTASQVTIPDSSDFSAMLANKLNNTASDSTERTESGSSPMKTEYSKNEPKSATATQKTEQVRPADSTSATNKTDDGTDINAQNNTGKTENSADVAEKATKTEQPETEETVETEGIVIPTDADVTDITDELIATPENTTAGNITLKVTGRALMAELRNAGTMVKTSKKEFTAEVFADGELSEEDLEEIMELLSSMLQGMAQIFGVSLSDLQNEMNGLQMEPSDLLDDSMLGRLVLDMNGCSDMSEMLVDDDMLKSFEELKKMVSDMISDSGFTSEELENIFDNESFDAILKQVDVQLAETDGVFSKEYLSDLFTKNSSKENTEAAETNDEGPEVIITKVEKVPEVETKDSTGESDAYESDSEEDKVEIKSSARETGTTVTASAESFVQGLEKAASDMQLDTPVAENVTVRDIVYQLVDAIKVEVTPEKSSLEMRLNPESLGRVSLNIESHNGVMTARITTENQVSKEAIESQLQILKENIEARGVRVEAIEVTVSGFSFSDSKNADPDSREQSGGSSKRGARVGESARTDAFTDGEVPQQEIMDLNGSTVNYVA